MRRLLVALCIAAICLLSTACWQDSGRHPIVGTWIVKMPKAPFPYHMLVFHADGTMLQANPDAGDPNTSDSIGAGVWTAHGDNIKGKFVELMADRTTRKFVSRGEISFSLKVTGKTLNGTASASFYDAGERPLREPLSVTFDGQRVVP